MKKIFIYIILFIISIGAADSYAVEIQIKDDKISLYADQVPLQQILHRIAEMGIRVQIDPKINPEITASFKKRDIQAGVESILKSLNHVLIWESFKLKDKRSFKLAEIQIFRHGQKGLMESLNKNLSVVKNPKDGSLFVRDELLLRLKPGTSISELEKLLRKIQGTITDSNPELGLYNIRLPENSDVPAIAEYISRNFGGAVSEPNYAYPVSLPFQSPSSDESSKDIYAVVPDGTVPIAILDTGFNQDSGMNDLVLASLDTINPGEDISDSQGHGTQMALIAAGVVKPYGASGGEDDPFNPVIPIRAFDDNGYTSDFKIMESINFAIENGARVMSLSWSSETKSEFLEDAMDYADSKGLIVVAAAGNEPTGKPVYPAAYSSVIAVGALDPDGNTWKNSNYGNFVNLYAPGYASLPVGYNGDPGMYAGTSISTAFVANQIATYLSQNPDASKQDVLKEIQK